MTIRLTKGRGKPDTLSCRRADGSCTWAAVRYVTHDLGHCAIEATLGFHDGFFGLLAQGWAIQEFEVADPVTGKTPRVPLQAMQTEALACLLDIERHSGHSPDRAEFAQMLTLECHGLGILAPEVTWPQWQAVRACHAALLERWACLPEGQSWEWEF